MTITQKINMDLSKHGLPPCINAVQGDAYTRQVELSLLDDGKAWTIPGNVKLLVRFVKPDGTGGEYDALPDGTEAGTVSGNVISMVLAPQILTAAGAVRVNVTLLRDAQEISTFDFLVNVYPNAGSQLEESVDYYHVSGFLPMPERAEAGQFIRVQQVDDQGITRKVEAVTAEEAELWVPEDMSYDLTGMSTDVARQTIMLGGPVSLGEDEAIRIRRLAVKATSGVTVRFGLFRFRDGMLTKLATLGEAVAENGLATLSPEGGYRVQVDQAVIVAMADSAGIGCHLVGSGVQVTGQLEFEDGDYFASENGTQIPCDVVMEETAGPDDIWFALYVLEADHLSRKTVEGLLKETDGELAALDKRIDGLLPRATALDNGKVLTVAEGKYVLKKPEPVQVSGLPDVTEADNGKVLKVVSGMWTLGEDLAGGGTESVTTLLETQTVGGFVIDENFGLYCTEMYSLPFTMSVGDTYRITWDGEDYICAAGDGSGVAAAGAVALGNGSFMGLPGNGEPFAMIYYQGTLIIGAVDPEDSRGSHSVGIYQDNMDVTETYIKYYVGSYIEEALGGDY